MKYVHVIELVLFYIDIKYNKMDQKHIIFVILSDLICERIYSLSR